MTPARPAAAPLAAVIDIGTNSVKLLVGRVTAGRVHTVDFARATTRLGEGLGARGRISPAATARTARAVRAFAMRARRAGATQVVAVGTQALRAAANGRAVALRIGRAANVEVRILGGREEALAAFLSARSRLVRRPVHTILIDVGGGSTELVVARGARVVSAHSLPLGALRLTERYLPADPIDPGQYASMQRAIARTVARVLSRHRLDPTATMLVASGGTATTAVTMSRRARAGAAGTTTVTIAALRHIETECLSRTIAQRTRLAGLPADRADILPAGLAVVLEVMRALGKRTLVVSAGGVRDGVLLSLYSTRDSGAART